MKMCFTSYRPFPDGPLTEPLLESDPANIAYVLGGDYLSFYTLKQLSPAQLAKKLQPYDLIFVALDVDAIELVQRIVLLGGQRCVTYSENHIGDYQKLAPAQQGLFVQCAQKARLNLLYWEKYVPFYRALTDAPVAYLPLPYPLAYARSKAPAHQPRRGALLPTGLHGYTRNGLANAAVAKQLLRRQLVPSAVFGLEAPTFAEDCAALQAFLLDQPFTYRPARPAPYWQSFFLAMRYDYRWLLQLKRRLFPTARPTLPAPVTAHNLTFFPRQSWSHYLSWMAQTQVLIDMNNRETVGRNAMDCAALGIPCVGSDRSDMQGRLFPALTLADSWDVAGAVARCEKLLTEPDFYQAVVQYAAQQIQALDLPNYRALVWALLTEHQLV